MVKMRERVEANQTMTAITMHQQTHITSSQKWQGPMFKGSALCTPPTNKPGLDHKV